MTIDIDGNAPDIIIEPLELLSIYQKEYSQDVKINELSDGWKIELSVLQCNTGLFIKTTADASIEENTLRLKLQPGKNVIQFSVNSPVETGWKPSLAQSKAWWNNKWENSGILVLPDSNGRKRKVGITAKC